MAVFFQKVSDEQFNVASDFIVKESKGIKLFTGFFCLIFTVALFRMSLLAGGAGLIVTIFLFLKASRNPTIMKINKNGFYYYNELITDWPQFISVEFIDELPVITSTSAGTSDKFSLMIKYYKDGKPGYFGRKIPLTNIQDKSEEEIIAAINFYHKHNVQAGV